MARGVEFEYKNMGDAPREPEIPEAKSKPKGIPEGKAQAGTSGGGGGVMGAAPPEPVTSSPNPPPRTLAPNLEQLRAEGIRGVGGAETGPLGRNANPLEPTPNPAGRARVVQVGTPIPNTANLSPNARMALGGGGGAVAAGAGLLGAGALPVITAGLGTGLAAYGITNQIIEDVPGLKKGIERVGEALHGPITEGTEKAPDLNFMDTGAGVPSPAANIKPTAKKDMQTDLTAQAKPTSNVPKPDSPIDESQFRGPTGKGVNYKLDNAGNMVPDNVGDTKENPYDKELQNALAEMKWLSGLVVPAKSGIMADTVAQNYEIFERQKALEKIVGVLRPLTTEGMKLEAKGVPAPLHPAIEQAHLADAKYKNAQADALEPKTEVEEEKAIYKEKEKRNAFRADMIKNNPLITEDELATAERKAGFIEPIKRKYRLTAKGQEHIEAQEGWWGGKEYYNTKTGQKVKPPKE